MAGRLSITSEEASKLLDSTSEVITDALSRQQNLSITRLGTFYVKKAESRKAYSPVLDKHFMTPPRRLLEFQASDNLREKTRNIRKP